MLSENEFSALSPLDHMDGLDHAVNPEYCSVENDRCVEFNILSQFRWSDPSQFNAVHTVSEDLLVRGGILGKNGEIKTRFNFILLNWHSSEFRLRLFLQ